MNSDEEEEEEEVTFLLRLRPTPSPPASRRRKSSIGSTRPVSGSGWDVVIERQGTTPPPPCPLPHHPQRRTSVGGKPTWDMSSPLPSAPPPAEVLNPWVYQAPQHPWGTPYVSLVPNLSWAQHGMDYQIDATKAVPYQEEYSHHFESPNMYFHPLSVERTSYPLPSNYPLHPKPQIPNNLRHTNTTNDRIRNPISPEPRNGRHRPPPIHKKSNSFDNEYFEPKTNLKSVKSISLSHGNLPRAVNKEKAEFIPPVKQSLLVNNGIKTDKTNGNRNSEINNVCVDGNMFLNTFRRYSLNSETVARVSMEQFQKSQDPDSTQGHQDNRTETKPPALPPRPPKPARFSRDSQHLDTTKWVRMHFSKEVFIT